MKIQNLKIQNGITLIALIITIIVMLILVGVTINILTSSGLIGKAKEASDKTEISRIEEEIEIAKASCYDTKTGKIDLNKLEQELKEIKGVKRVERISNAIKVYYQDKIMTITSSGESTLSVNDDLKELEYYVVGEFVSDLLSDDYAPYKKYITWLGADLWEITSIGNTVSEEDLLYVRGYIWLTFKDNTYKLTAKVAENNGETDYKVISAELTDYNNINSSLEGKYVSYNSQKWIVFNDNGYIELISADSLGNLKLLGNTAEETVSAYNNAIDNINSYCNEVLAGETTYKESVRSVGASNDSNTGYYKTNMEWTSKYDGQIKETDTEYKSDFEKMAMLGIVDTDNPYYIASRMSIEASCNK